MELSDLNEEKLLFLDVEVFKFNAFVVFKNLSGETIKIYSNNFEGLAEFIEGKILVGYNIDHYDIHIIEAMRKCWTVEQIKERNDDIIVRRMKFKNTYGIETLDCFQQIALSFPSLKKIEGNMGKMILESSVDFTIERALTPHELQESIEYCEYDVDMTIEVFKQRISSYFQPKLSLVERLKKKNAMQWNTTTISANLLTPVPLPRWSSIRLHQHAQAHRDMKNLDMFKFVPEEVAEHWLDKIENNYTGQYKGNITIDKFDCNIEFGFGGLHGVHKYQSRFENVKLLDVKSMYPHIIMIINALESASPKYREILLERIAVKHKDRVLSDALKLILNSVYGNLKNKYSILFDPMKSLSVCLFGQIALYNLCERLAPTCTLVNINTDGVAFQTDSDDYLEIWKEWEADFNLELEEDKFDIFIQKDVNNYIAVTGDEIETKGGDVSKYKYDSNFNNNNTRIIDIAIVEYLVNGKDIIDTLNDNLNDPKLYQYVLQAGYTYKGSVDGEGNPYQKINRVFATKHEENSITLFKQRTDGGLVRYPNSPDKMFLWNDDVNKLEDFKDIIDISHYYTIIADKLVRWGVTL